MRQIQKIILVFCLLFGVGLFTTADEGMWMPHQMKDLNLKALGLAMNPDELYKKDGTGLMSAVVYLGGGTGEFVSPDGLILTNHHVAFGALQRASSKENDYIQNGFIAWTRGEEIQAKGYIADVLLGYEEVTDKILSGLATDMTPRDRYEAIDQAKKRIIAEEESQGKDLRATVATMYSGNQYYLFRFQRIKDIRLVLAPPQDLGNFGGDIDNWMWPRHTCDFSFLRAYVSKENTGVDYSPDNVPYKPKAFLKISLDGFQEGDFSFVMGYPGRTYRNHTLSELESDIADMKERMSLYRDIIGFLEEAGRDSREIQIKYASAVQGLNNSLKNYQGKIEGMAKISLVDKKKDAERQFLDWVEQDPARKKKYGTPLQDMADFMEKYAAHDKKVTLLSRLTSSYFGSALLSQAYTVYRTIQERQKPDMEREPSFQERQLPYIKMQIELAERRYDPDVDRALLKHQLKRLLDLAEEERPTAFRELLGQKSEEAINSFVDDLYRCTSLANPKKRLEMIELTPQALAEVGDPMIALAEDIEKEMKGLREEGKALDQEHLDLKKVYLEALLEMTVGRIAPDANGTIRFTYGFIQGYKPRDAVYYRPQTSLAGVVEKDKGEFPFLVPEGLKELYDQRDFGRYADKSLGDVPVCFLNTTNVTGGNSGSPTLNAKGEQVGIIFDMTYESVTGDYYVVPELQRSISVDIRYVLFITERFSGAKHIIKELGL